MNDVFEQGEGDAYFNRNKHRLNEVAPGDLMTEALLKLGVKNKKVLDIGCANGHRLAKLAQEGAIAFGIEPSNEAVVEGKKKFPNISLTQGVAHNLSEFEDASFDIVFLSYVLHWVERKNLLKTISEIDRVLKDGGNLLIADLYPDKPHKRAYHHRTDTEVFTYKQHYEEIFLASNLYEVLEYISFNHNDQTKRVDTIGPGDESGRLIVMRKDLESFYPKKEN